MIRPSLLLVTLVLVTIMIVGGNQSAIGSAGAASPAADEPVAPDLLFEAIIPAGTLPPNPVWIDVYRMAWDPEATWPYAETYRSLRVWCVEAGQLAIQAEGPVLVTLGPAGDGPAGMPAAATPGTEVVLDAEDCAVTPADRAFTLRNPGPDPAVVAHGMVVPANVDVPGGYPFGQVREEEPFGSSMYSFDLPSETVSVRLERLPLPPNTSRQEAFDLFPAAGEGTERVVRVATSQDPPVAYAISVRAAPSDASTPALATSAAGIVVEVLAEVTFDPELAPTDVVAVELLRYEIAPGVDLTYPAPFVPPAVEFAYVEAGTYAIRPHAAAQVVRGGAATQSASAEPVAAGAEAMLEPGDAFVIPAVPIDALGREALGGLSNPGATPLRAIGVVIWTEVPTMAPAGMDLSWYSYMELPTVDGAAMPAGPVTLTLSRATLEPAAQYPAAAAGTVQIVADETGAAGTFAAGSDGVIRNSGQAPLVVLILSIAPTA